VNSVGTHIGWSGLPPDNGTADVQSFGNLVPGSLLLQSSAKQLIPQLFPLQNWKMSQPFMSMSSPGRESGQRSAAFPIPSPSSSRAQEGPVAPSK